MSPNILVIDDGPEVAPILRAALDPRHEVSWAPDAETARRLIADHPFDLVLMDVNLPDVDGFALTEEFRDVFRTERTAVIFLTSRVATEDKVHGFAIGADDYVVKPFDPVELRARIEGRLRSRAAERAAPEVVVEDLTIDPAAFRARAADADLGLTPIEFKLLYALVSRRGQVASREVLIAKSWGPDIHVSDRVVDRHISSLRKKLGPRATWIATLPGEGYLFTGPVSGSS